jgi:DNA-binding winged helix-turn-helix (wHTH) protein
VSQPTLIEPTLHFREAIATHLFDLLAAGESCTILGIGSVGKSNLLRFLARDDVRRHYLGDEADEFLIIYVDANKVLQRSAWGLWEVLLHQLVTTLTERGIDKEVIGQVEELHERGSRRKRRFLALRYLDRALALICGQRGYRVAFLLDDLDSLAADLDPSAYAGLRALRDDHKYRLTYVVATRTPLALLCEDPAEIEALADLVNINSLWLGPYDADDAQFMLHRLEARYGRSLPAERGEQVLRVSGGHSGLLRAAFRLALDASPDKPLAYLADRGVCNECYAVWRSLSPQEQGALDRLAAGLPLANEPQEVVRQLKSKGMLGGAWADEGVIFTPLFADFVRQMHPFSGQRVTVDPGRHCVTVDGREIGDLTDLEFRVVACLAEHRGEILSRDALAELLYPNEMGAGGDVSNDRIDAAVKRARAKIEPVPGEHQLIVAVRGVGYKLDDGEVDDAQ